VLAPPWRPDDRDAGPRADQAPNAATVQEWRAGRTLPGDADVEPIGSAARDGLWTSSYGRNATRISAALAGGAANAADKVEATS